MKEFWRFIELVIAALGAWIGLFLGECDKLIIALVVFIVADYLTGVMRATIEKKLSSEVGFRGICKKILIFVMVGIANVLDTKVIGVPGVLRTAAIFFYISNEGISLLENAVAVGLPVPEQIRDVLEQLRKEKEYE